MCLCVTDQYAHHHLPAPVLCLFVPTTLTRMTTIKSLSSESLRSSSSRVSQAPGESSGGATDAVSLPAAPLPFSVQDWSILPSQLTLTHAVSTSAKAIEPPRLRNPP